MLQINRTKITFDVGIGRLVDFFLRNHIHQMRDVIGQHFVDDLEQPRLERVELREVLVHEALLHLFDLGEVAGRDLVVPLDTIVDLSQLFDELFLLLLLAEDGRHVLPQLGDYVGVDFGEPGPFDQVVQLAKRRISREALHIFEQVVLFVLEQLAVAVVPQRLVPKRADVDSGDFGGLQNFAE